MKINENLRQLRYEKDKEYILEMVLKPRKEYMVAEYLEYIKVLKKVIKQNGYLDKRVYDKMLKHNTDIENISQKIIDVDCSIIHSFYDIEI